jgi:hypothetical protein
MTMAIPEGCHKTIKDPFLLSYDIVGASMVGMRALSRNVLLPRQDWEAEDSAIHAGGAAVNQNPAPS